MLNRGPANPPAVAGGHSAADARGGLPRPTLQFRLKAWRTYQRALDPLAPPKPLRPPGPLQLR